MRECRDGNEDSTPEADGGPSIDIETKVCTRDGQVRLFVSADDIVRVVTEVTRNLERTDGTDPTVAAQVAILDELAGALLAAIATVNTE